MELAKFSPSRCRLILALVLFTLLGGASSVRAQTASGSTWPNGYSYQGVITVPAAQVPNTNQVNFPVLVSGTFSELAAGSGKVTNPNGYDIIFASDVNGLNKLNFQRESYVSATGQAMFWVQVPLLSHTATTVFYVFYGNPAVTTDQSNKAGVWDSGYVGVWHMGDSAANTAVLDSTGNANHGTAAANTSGKTAAGMAGGALSFNGTTDGVTTNAFSGKAFTWEAWIKSGAITSAAYQSIVTQPGNSYMLMDVQSGAGSFWSPDGLGGANLGITGLANNTWYHLVLVRSGDSSASGYRAYLNGVPKAQAASGVWSSASNLAFGTRVGLVGQNFNGTLDEVRVSNTVRSADWIATEYRNLSDPSFYSILWNQTSGFVLNPTTTTLTSTAPDPVPNGQGVALSAQVSGTATGTVTFMDGASVLGPGTLASGVATFTATGLAVGPHSFTAVYGGDAQNASSTSGALTRTVSPPVSNSQWPNGYSYQGVITVPAAQVPNTNQVNFPVLVSGTFSELAAGSGKVTNPNGYDIIFASDVNGLNKLNFQRESYVSATGQAMFWVQVPLLSHTATTVFYVFYGNPAVTTDQSNKAGVWDSGYVGVWHMGDSAANTAVLDSTGNANHGTAAANTSGKTAAGMAGGALSFNGTTDGVTTNAFSGKAFTWEAWIKSGAITSAAYQSIVTQPGNSYMLMDVQSGAGSFWSPDGLGGANLGITGLANNTWYHLVLVRSGDSSASGYRAYLNGVPKAQAASGVWSSASNLAFGTRVGLVGQNFNGTLDEVRVSNTVRSADWIATEYRNLSDPSFYSILWNQTSGFVLNPTTTTLTSTAPDPVPNGQGVALSAQVSGTATGTVTFMDGASVLGPGTLASGVATFTATGLAIGPHSFTAAYGGDAQNAPSTSTALTRTVSPPVSGLQWPNGYSYQGVITVPAAQVANTNQVNFPVLVSGTFSELAAGSGKVTSPNGYDIIFASDVNGLNKLSFQRESYISPTGQAMFWVQVPLLSHTANTVFYVFYGNPSVTTDQSNKAGVWDSGYVGVWHMGDSAANTTVLDSTGNANHGTAAANTSGKTAAGMAGGALSFNGTTDGVTTGVISGKTFTWEAWISSANLTNTAYQSILTQAGNSYMLMDLQTGAGSFWSADAMGGQNLGIAGLANNTWYHVALVRSGNSSPTGYTAYLNGVQKGQTASGSFSGSSPVTFGTRTGLAGQNFSGTLDEVRVSNTARSADWIATEYRNESSLSSFYSIAWGQTFTGVASPPPLLSTYPSSLTFSGISAATTPTPSQPVLIYSSNSGTLNGWTATPSDPWMAISSSVNGIYSAQPISGTGPATIYVQALLSALDRGPYVGTLTITSADATGSPLPIPVSLTVVPDPATAPPVSPSNLFFSATLNSSNPTPQAVSITGPSGKTLGSWQAIPSDPWITVSTSSGTGPQTIAVGTASSSMGLGRYTGAVTITSAGAPQTIALTLVIAPIRAADSGGQTLYNGIVLPAQWPPTGSATQAYSIPPYIANPPAAIKIDVGRQLFVDDFLIQQTTLVRTQHQPVMYAGNPILAPNGLNADATNMTFPYSDGVWFDPQDHLFKMWFYCGFGAQVCYATSTDGKNWVRPSIPGAPLNNTDVVLGPIGGGRDSDVVWMDLQDPNPAQKFKLFAYYPTHPVSTMLTWFSPDGISWTSQPQFTIDSLQDRTTLFWNPFRSVWVDSMRQQFTVPATPYRGANSSERMRFYAESPNLSTWKPANFGDSFWTGPDENDPPYVPGGTLPQLYNLDAVAYESVMVGLFSWFHPGPTDGSPPGAPGPDVVELGVGFSRDGFHWVRPTRGGGPSNAFIPASNTPNTWNEGNTQSTGGGFLVMGDQLWFYFSGRAGDHSSSPGGSTGLATLRRDGFYSMNAGSAAGTLTTRPLTFPGKNLFVNVKVPQGTLQVQVLNSTGTVLANSAPITADSTLQQVTWSDINDLSDLAAQQPLRFQFTLTNGELYAFWVSPDASGASKGYVAAGGPGFTSNVDTVGTASLSAAAAIGTN